MQSIYNSSNLQLLRVHLRWRDGLKPLEFHHDSFELVRVTKFTWKLGFED